MAVFLDTGNLDEIERFLRMGVVRGVTTNPCFATACSVAWPASRNAPGRSRS